MRKTRVKVKNRKTGQVNTVKIPAKIAERWSSDGGLLSSKEQYQDSLKYLEKQINSKSGSIDANGYIVLKIGS